MRWKVVPVLAAIALSAQSLAADQIIEINIRNAGDLVTALQTVVSRGLGYEGGAVVTVGRFIADGSHNVIPDKVYLEGTLRTFDPAVTERVLALERR